jgi:hypothetical protein
MRCHPQPQPLGQGEHDQQREQLRRSISSSALGRHVNTNICRC